jgi:hypothetical protein
MSTGTAGDGVTLTDVAQGPDAAQSHTDALGLGPAAAAEAKPKAAAAAAASKPGMVTLAPLPPLSSVTLPGAGKDGADLVIDEAGLEVDEDTAAWARETAWLSGLRLREI